MTKQEEIIRTPEQKEAFKAYRASLKREEIRDGVITNIVKKCPNLLNKEIVALADAILKDENSQGVVIEVDRELPECGISKFLTGNSQPPGCPFLKTGYVAWEPLIEEGV